MFAKALWPTDLITVPLLLLTAPPELVELLHQRGWVPFASDVVEADAMVTITADGLTFTVDGQLMMSGLNPAAPQGWWKMVDVLEQHVMVVVLPEETDLTSGGLLAVLSGLRDDARSAQALARIATGIHSSDSAITGAGYEKQSATATTYPAVAHTGQGLGRGAAAP